MTLEETTTTSTAAPPEIMTTTTIDEKPPAMMMMEKSSSSHSADASLHKSESTMLDASADPFATREGKTLTWTNVNMTLVSKTQQDANKIINV